ncbi:MAG TPA: iron chelate uptake ABC transporter family permease subunit, partial [Acidimicrobiales bacterium]|nr:iron chelate uptake ABC transporter family permease subunit [Acidimicrobiales bacterium]
MRRRTAVLLATLLLLASLFVGVLVGPVGISAGDIFWTLVAHVPLLHVRTSVPQVDRAIVWQLRTPRVVLAALVGAMLAGGGASYQGVFRNPLADPYLLGVAAGAGLGATIVITSGGGSGLLPVAAFLGAVVAVVMT